MGPSDSRAEPKNKTVQSQIEEARLALPNLPDNHVFTDEAVSGSVPFRNRPGSAALFAQLSAAASAGRKSSVMVQFVDRIGRDAADTIGTYNTLMKLGVRIVSPYEGEFSDNPDSALRITIFAGMAQYVKARILAGSKAGMKRKAEEGKFFTGGPPAFGYIVTGEKLNGKRRTGMLVIDEPKAEIIRRLYEDAAAGKSSPKLAEYLNDIGVPTPRQNPGRKWTRMGVREIITNPTYKGDWPYGTKQHIESTDAEGNVKRILTTKHGKPITPRTCPAIVSEDLWQRANDALKLHRLIKAGQARTEYLLAGLIKCGICGRTYSGRGYAYMCGGRQNKTGCNGSIIKLQYLESIVWEQCEAYLCNPGDLIRDLEREIAASVAPERNLDDEIAKAAAQIERINHSWDRARWQWQQEEASTEQWQRDNKHYGEQHAAATARHDELKQQKDAAENSRRALGEVRSALEQLRESVRDEKFSFEDKRRIALALVAGITILPLPTYAEARSIEYEFNDQVEIRFRFNRERGAWPPKFTVPDDDSDSGGRRKVVKGLAPVVAKATVSTSHLARMRDPLRLRTCEEKAPACLRWDDPSRFPLMGASKCRIRFPDLPRHKRGAFHQARTNKEKLCSRSG